jgi:hypothetical protein
MTRTPRSIFAFAAALLLASPAIADEPDTPVQASSTLRIEQPAPAPPTPRHTGIKATLTAVPHDFKHLVSLENLLWVGVGSGVAAAIHPVDDNINRHFAGTSSEDVFFGPGKYIGQTATLVASSLTVYAIGRINDQPKVSHIGMDLIRALVVDETLTETLKFASRRERPDASDHHSFPSGHASTTFAVATVLERHVNWKMSVPAYLFASYVAMSRLHENRHFASDVAFGAAVGIISGRTVTRPGSDHYAIGIAPVPGGMAMMVVKK